MLSHELRNPLAAVINATTLLAEQPRPPTSRMRCQAVIERQARHMARLLDDLLDVSRITRGKFQLSSTSLDLRAAIESARSSRPRRCSPSAASRSTTRCRASRMPVRGDASRLQQVIVNLLSNAANYSPRGSAVELRRRGEGRRMRPARHRPRRRHRVRACSSKIFELFVQAEQRLDRPRGGLGVGLSLAKNIVELHGGTIEVSQRRRRHRQRVRRDAAARLARRPREPPRLRRRRGRGERCRIVLVDDQADSREMLRHAPRVARPRRARRRGRREPRRADRRARSPTSRFIDIGLPAMNGYEVAQRIRGDPGARGRPARRAHRLRRAERHQRRPRRRLRRAPHQARRAVAHPGSPREPRRPIR